MGGLLRVSEFSRIQLPGMIRSNQKVFGGGEHDVVQVADDGAEAVGGVSAAWGVDDVRAGLAVEVVGSGGRCQPIALLRPER